MKNKITYKDILNFIEGNSRMFLSNLQPKHIKEQVSYRLLLCEKDCKKLGKCIKCGCSYPNRVYSSNSCNIERFPDIMNDREWEKFKHENNIDEQHISPEGEDNK